MVKQIQFLELKKYIIQIPPAKVLQLIKTTFHKRSKVLVFAATPSIFNVH